MTTRAIALILPILNEAEFLPVQLNAIACQTLKPTEILFVDAGSTDGSQALIDNWWATEGWEGGRCQVLHNPWGMPGANRNLGIRTTQAEWIAFLDGGMEPEPDWLEQLSQFCIERQSKAAFGICHFFAENRFESAICALSYGYDSVHPVIPASLFHRDIFTEVGFFPEHLSATEDLFWVKNYIANRGHALFAHRPWCTITTPPRRGPAYSINGAPTNAIQSRREYGISSTWPTC